MSSYHLPIILGKNQSERIVIVHLVDDSEVHEENRIVITSIANSSTPLFKIYDGTQLIGMGDEDLIKPAFDKGSNLIEVSVGDNRIEPKHSNGYWHYRIKTAEFDDVVTFSITITVDGNDCTFVGELHIVRPSASQQIMRINADLGSDATQINFFIPGKGTANSQKINLIQYFKDAYKPDRQYDLLARPESKDPLFIQQEKGSKDFYKTGNITFHVGGNIDASINSSETFINYINVSASGKNESSNSSFGAVTWEKEKGFNRKLINIKMLYAHSDMPEVADPVEDVVFHDNANPLSTKSVSDQMSLLQVLQVIYKQLIKVSTDGVAQECKLFSVLLLVPNIYKQENIDLLLYEVNKMNKNADGRKYDFRIISESDSAFVGIKEAKLAGVTGTILGNLLSEIREQRQKNTFLIIDAGKGTTDYSIVRYDSESNNAANSNMISLKRGGIVGAGGAIDYVFARILARQIYNHLDNIIQDVTQPIISKSMFVDHFMHLIEKLTPRDQDKMMLYVELLKKSYKEGSIGQNGQVARVYTCFTNKDAKTIVKRLLKEKMTHADYNSIVGDEGAWKDVSQWVWDNQVVTIDQVDKQEVDWVCTAIANTIINDMIFVKKDSSLTKQIDYVIFNGRSFLFKPLKDAFQNVIEEKRGIWYENWGFLTYVFLKFRCVCLKFRPKESHKNLKIAPLSGFNMKAVSVQFEDHDLGVNCNSDLCCMEGIEMEGGEIFGQEQFCKGFTAIHNNVESTHHYIGYVSGDTAHSFAPYLSQGVNMAAQISDTRKKLVLMTLFPVRYELVFDDMSEVLVSGKSSVASTTPVKASPQHVQKGNINETNVSDNNNLETPSENHPVAQTNYHDAVDNNDL